MNVIKLFRGGAVTYFSNSDILAVDEQLKFNYISTQE